MSYDIDLTDPVTGKPLDRHKHLRRAVVRAADFAISVAIVGVLSCAVGAVLRHLGVI